VHTVSPWLNPIVPIRKPDSRVRLCADYRRLEYISPHKGNLLSAIELGHKNYLPRVLTVFLIKGSFSYTATYMNDSA